MSWLKLYVQRGCAAVGSSRADLRTVMGAVGGDDKALLALEPEAPAVSADVAAALLASDEARLLALLRCASLDTDALHAYVTVLRTGGAGEGGASRARFEQWERAADVWDVDAPFAFDACAADEMGAAVIRAHALYYANALRGDFAAYSAAAQRADGAVARAMAACAAPSTKPSLAELRHRVAAGKLLKKLITVRFLLFTVTFYAKYAHNVTRSP